MSAAPATPDGASPGAFAIVGIDHLVLRVVDLDRTLRFYRDALGCRVERRLDAIGLVQLRAGRSLVDLVPVDGPLGAAGGAPPAREGRNVDHFCLRVEPFDEAALRDRLGRFGIVAGPTESRYGAEGGGPSIYVTDPDGNVVELKGPPAAEPVAPGDADRAAAALDPRLLDLPTALETERLHLRPPRAADAPVLLEALTESLPELRRFLASLPWVAAEQTLASAERFCRRAEADFVARTDLPFLLFSKADGALVGVAGLHRIDWRTPKVEVGYWGRTSRARHGFIGEAVRALCGYAFEHLRVVRVELITDRENDASRRLAGRCGFELEGTLRHERRSPDGSLRDTCVYARLAPPGSRRDTGGAPAGAG